MIENYLVDQQTKDATGIFNSSAFTLPARFEDGVLIALTSEECNDVLTERQALKQVAEENKYKVQRAAAYPSIADQLDLLYHGGMDAWKAAITAVKEEFPK